MTAVRWLLALVMLIGLGAAAYGAEVPIPPSPTHWATDTAGFLQPQTVAALDQRLRSYQTTTGHQILVYVAPTTGDTPTEDWTVRAFAHWKVGRKGMDDGLILFVFSKDRKVRIEVGYGLEQTVPDAIAARIIRDITPKLQAGQPDAAVVAGVNEILATIGGETSSNAAAPAPAAAPVQYATPSPYDSDTGNNPFSVTLGILIGLLIVVGVLWTLSKIPRGKYISSGSSGIGWGGLILGTAMGGLTGGFSGGFSGGGGLSGGGGATGSW
jgi:uncharacterized protein